MKLLLIIPPMTQVNTPYPSTAYLTQYLREQGFEVEQRDLGIDLFHKLLSGKGLERIQKKLAKLKNPSEIEEYFISAFPDYLNTIDSVIAYLQGKDPTLALRIAKRMLLPEGPRFVPLDDHEDEISSLFGEMGLQDKAKYLASLYLDDLADLIKNSVDERFEFSRYGESLASSQASFTPLYHALKNETLVDQMMFECVDAYVDQIQPTIVGFTLPFPGNVYGALKTAKYLKQKNSKLITVAGGGFVNTELRELSDIRFFEYIDYLLFDNGEMPFLKLLNYLKDQKTDAELTRTWFVKEGKIVKASAKNADVAFKTLSGPTYDGLDSDRYIPMLEMPNPMYRMWSDFRWNKLILAHGCYWKKCTFCDVSLDYIGRYEPTQVDTMVASIERLVEETKQTGFHFVDEAAPPALVKSLSEKLIEKELKISWWGNLRFDKSFEQIAPLMAEAGCVAVTGGLEVASPRILKLIDKGVSIEQVAKVTKAFTENGIYVHAYLMYGFPSQTAQETVDSLEIVRQLFENDCIQSAYWHRFMCTAHSPVGLDPEKYGIELIPIETPETGLFAKNTVYYNDKVQTNHDQLGEGLRKAVYNFMHGLGLEENVMTWFPMPVPKTTIKKDYIKNLFD